MGSSYVEVGDGYGLFDGGFDDGDGEGDGKLSREYDDTQYVLYSVFIGCDGRSRISFIRVESYSFVPLYIVGDFEASVILSQLVIHKEKR